jgi:hypothetical protein
VPLPVGYVYDDEGGVVIDPDAEVAAAVADVFAAFAATGSAYAVAGAFAGRRFPRRAYGGAWAGQIRWGRLTHARAAGILTNPVYAGAYVFGRRRTRQVVHPDGSVHSSTTELPREQWQVLIHDHHEAYVSWEQLLAIEAKLAGNRTNAGARPPREGTALCQGVVFCGACGRSMQVRYQDRHAAGSTRPTNTEPSRTAPAAMRRPPSSRTATVVGVTQRRRRKEGSAASGRPPSTARQRAASAKTSSKSSSTSGRQEAASPAGRHEAASPAGGLEAASPAGGLEAASPAGGLPAAASRSDTRAAY